MTDAMVLRYQLSEVLDSDAWSLLDAPFGTAYRTWMHASDRWAVVLCTRGEMSGRVRVTEMDTRYRHVSLFDADRDWFHCGPSELWLRLWESGAPDVTRPPVAAEPVGAAS